MSELAPLTRRESVGGEVQFDWTACFLHTVGELPNVDLKTLGDFDLYKPFDFEERYTGGVTIDVDGVKVPFLKSGYHAGFAAVQTI